MNNNIKSATTAGLLGIFLGSVGAHDWYLGNKKKGIIHVCLAASGLLVFLIASVILPTALSYRTYYHMIGLIGILSTIAGLIMAGNSIWGFVEGIIILSQGDAGLVRKGYMTSNPGIGYNSQTNFTNNMNQNVNPNNNQNNGFNNGGMNL